MLSIRQIKDCFIQLIKGEDGLAIINENDDEIISGINITPLVDIMLVLLIIFMLVSTVADFNSIDIELPHAATGKEIHTKTVAVMISNTGLFYLAGEKLSSADELKEKLRIRKNENPEIQVVISADKKTYHENIVRVIDIVRSLEINGFAINVEYLEESSSS